MSNSKKASHRRRNNWMPRFAEQSKLAHHVRKEKLATVKIHGEAGPSVLAASPLSTQH